MTKEKKTIILNIIATYSRSLVILFVGLLSSRWLLLSLGETDYGLLGLVGSLAVFITFINTLLSTAVSRYYAVSEGERIAGIAGAEENIQRWFNTAISIHVIASVSLVIIGYPLGVYAIKNWLVIPDERIDSCFLVFTYSCVACFFGMISVPFSAMFIAKQKIAEYSIYNTIIPVFTAVFSYRMTTYEKDWFVEYSFFLALVTVFVYITICVRAFFAFHECRINTRMLNDKIRQKQLLGFAGWQCFGNLGAIIRSQGMAILGNMQFGPEVNAALTISNKVSAQTDSLSASLKTAFAPAIANAYGENDIKKLKQYVYITNKIGTMLVLVFALPICLEIEAILNLWLKKVPEHTSFLCVFILLALIVDKTTSGHMLAVSATGKIALYQSVLGSFLIFALPLAFILIKVGFGVKSIGLAILITTMMCAWGRVFLAKRVIDLSSKKWLKEILLPGFFTTLASFICGFIPHLLMSPGINRLIVASIISESVLLFLVWFVLFENTEKQYIKETICARLFKKKSY